MPVKLGGSYRVIAARRMAAEAVCAPALREVDQQHRGKAPQIREKMPGEGIAGNIVNLSLILVRIPTAFGNVFFIKFNEL